MNIAILRKQYAAGRTPVELVASIYDRIEAAPLAPVWISLVPREQAIARARALTEGEDARALPLYGIPFAVKDNIDVEGMPTTAGCPAFAYSPATSATVVTRLLDAGAILVGKTNLDQFATGLVGTRSPHGACSSVFGEEYISGGSSSGSAVAVASELVAFSLGTDTAGSGRVPAAFNNLIGVKPTKGLLSTTGVVPACRSLDCVSIFAHTCGDAKEVWSVASGFDASDPFSRTPRPGEGASPWLGSAFCFGVPHADQLEFFDDSGAATLFEAAASRLQSLGGHRVEIDFSVFRAAADLLYSGPWVAERLAALRDFIPDHGTDMDPVVRQIVSGATRYTAVDGFLAEYRLRELRRATDAEWAKIDVLLLPTTGTIYTHKQIAVDPIKLNTNLGYYTNFVNLLDLAAVAVPAGFRANGLPFGVSLIGEAFSDQALLALAAKLLDEPALSVKPPPGCIDIAVAGAHLSGQPLNWQLKDHGARLQRTVRTAAGYRFYALSGTTPAKPGLFRDDRFQGSGIELEVWAMPEDQFGRFVAAVPPPLTIGTVTLENGESVKCFLCEPAALEGAREITQFGGWRGYLKSGGA
ncbi:MAG TPA: allophanate hydrolase [Bryobacteraceae bacterium]|jgi:allophanate hydrolase